MLKVSETHACIMTVCLCDCDDPAIPCCSLIEWLLIYCMYDGILFHGNRPLEQLVGSYV